MADEASAKFCTVNVLLVTDVVAKLTGCALVWVYCTVTVGPGEVRPIKVPKAMGQVAVALSPLAAGTSALHAVMTAVPSDEESESVPLGATVPPLFPGVTVTFRLMVWAAIGLIVSTPIESVTVPSLTVRGAGVVAVGSEAEKFPSPLYCAVILYGVVLAT